MPRPKKAEKQKKEEIVLDLRQDREEFLRAFEKPTQIYRFLRARQCISPIFLHRSLLYMLDRCSRTNARRKVFRVDDMLRVCEFNQTTSTGANSSHYDQLKIVISGFYIDPGVQCENNLAKKLSSVDTEVSVRKTMRCRRKDGESLQLEELIDTVEVSVNPRNPENYVEEPILLTTSDIYQSSDGQSVKNYSLVFRVYEPQDDSSDSDGEIPENLSSDDDDDDDSTDGRKRKRKDDPAAISLKNLTTGSRRRRTLNEDGKDNESDEEDGRQRADSTGPPRKFKKYNNERIQAAIYEADLTIFMSDKQSVLLDGEYELSLNRKSAESGETKRNATWEALDGGREIKVLSTMNSSPILKFKLSWSENNKPGPLASTGSENKTSSCVDEPDTKRIRRRKVNDDDKSAESDNMAEKLQRRPVDLVEYRKPRKIVEKLSNGDMNGVHDSISIIYYQFIYNSETQQQTEARDDLLCPWCQLNCATLYGLIKHLKMSHPRFNFTYVPQAHGACVEVSVNECYDGSYCGNPQFIFAQPGMAFSRRGPVRRIQVTDTLVYRPRRERRASKMDMAELLEKEENETSAAAHYAAGHHRLYFHSDTSVPIRPCEFDVDSEEEPDPDWLRDHIKKMLDEFTDVNDGEKPLMKLWNLYIMKHNCIADAQMSGTCRAFIDQFGTVIVHQNLRRNLLLHLVTLVDFGVLKASALLSLMLHFDRIAEKLAKSSHRHNFKLQGVVSTNMDKFLHVSSDGFDSCNVKSEVPAEFDSVAGKKAMPMEFFDSDKSSHLAKLQMIINNTQKLGPNKQD